MVISLRGVRLPTLPMKRIFPLAVRLRSWFPSRVLLKVILEPLRLRVLLSATGAVNRMGAPLVIMLPPMVTAPAPICCRPPSKLKAIGDAVKESELFNVNTPPFAVETIPSKTILLVFNVIPVALVEVIPAEKVVVPVPPFWMKSPTTMVLLTLTFRGRTNGNGG